jgi:hypothetical protein
MTSPRRTRRRTRRRRIDWAEDRGQVGGIEVLPFSILIFVIGTLLVANAWAVIDLKMAVDAATREGVRSAAESSSALAARDSSRMVAREAIAGHGRDPGKLIVDPPDYHGGQFQRCNLVTVRASYPVPFISLPVIGTRGEAFTVTSSHTEIVDPFRSGLGERIAC